MIGMSENLALGVIVTIICLTIQCIVVSAMLRIIFSLEIRNFIRPTLPGTAVILATSFLYSILNVFYAARPGSDAVNNN